MAAIVNVTLRIGTTITAPLALTRRMFHTGRRTASPSGMVTLHQLYFLLIRGIFEAWRVFLDFEIMYHKFVEKPFRGKSRPTLLIFHNNFRGASPPAV